MLPRHVMDRYGAYDCVKVGFELICSTLGMMVVVRGNFVSERLVGSRYLSTCYARMYVVFRKAQSPSASGYAALSVHAVSHPHCSTMLILDEPEHYLRQFSSRRHRVYGTGSLALLSYSLMHVESKIP